MQAVPSLQPAAELLSRLLSGVVLQAMLQAAKLCARDLEPTAKLDHRQPKTKTLPPLRWYRIHPITDTTYFVRPDAGLRGRIPGYVDDYKSNSSEQLRLEVTKVDAPGQPVQSRHKRRRRSLPARVERGLGLPPDNVGTLCDNLCTICFDRPSRAVVLPCRHGGMCEQCLRRSIFSRPAHRGGRNCPLCRRRIRELVRIYDDAVYPQYGYAIRMT